MIPRFLLAAATALLLTACAKDAAKPEAPEAEADTAAVELHFHAIAGLNPGANGQAATTSSQTSIHQNKILQNNLSEASQSLK